MEIEPRESAGELWVEGDILSELVDLAAAFAEAVCQGEGEVG